MHETVSGPFETKNVAIVLAKSAAPGDPWTVDAGETLKEGFVTLRQMGSNLTKRELCMPHRQSALLSAHPQPTSMGREAASWQVWGSPTTRAVLCSLHPGLSGDQTR